MSVTNIPDSNMSTFTQLPKEVKWMILENLPTIDLLIAAHVSTEWRLLVKEIVEIRTDLKKARSSEPKGPRARLERRRKWIKLGGENAFDRDPVQLQFALRSLVNLKLKNAFLVIDNNEEHDLVLREMLGLFLGAVMAVGKAAIQVNSCDILSALFTALGEASQLNLKRLQIKSHPSDLDLLSDAHFINMSRLTSVHISLRGTDRSFDATRLLLLLAENPGNLEQLIVENEKMGLEEWKKYWMPQENGNTNELFGKGAFISPSWDNEDVRKLSRFITNLKVFKFGSPDDKYVCEEVLQSGLFPSILHTLAHCSNCNLSELKMGYVSFWRGWSAGTDRETVLAALSSLKKFDFGIFSFHLSQAARWRELEEHGVGVKGRARFGNGSSMFQILKL